MSVRWLFNDFPGFVKLVAVPKGTAQIRKLLRQREELYGKIEQLKKRRDELAHEKDERVYKLYELTKMR